MNDFKTISLADFNKRLDTPMTKDMNFDEAMCCIENDELNVFYTSMSKEDVTEAIAEEKDIADRLGLELLFIDEIGIYIALY